MKKIIFCLTLVSLALVACTSNNNSSQSEVPSTQSSQQQTSSSSQQQSSSSSQQQSSSSSQQQSSSSSQQQSSSTTPVGNSITDDFESYSIGSSSFDTWSKVISKSTATIVSIGSTKALYMSDGYGNASNYYFHTGTNGTDYVVEGMVRVDEPGFGTSNVGESGIMGRYVDQNKHVLLALVAGGKIKLTSKGDTFASTSYTVPGGVNHGTFYKIRMEFIGTTINCYFGDDTTPVITVTTSIPSGYAGFRVANTSYYDNFTWTPKA